MEDEKYFYETPQWAVITLCLITIIFSIFCFAAFYNWNSWASSEDPAFIRWFLLLVGLGFLSAGIRPRNWKSWRYFYADRAGLHFPSECPETKNTAWLTVPWSRVGTIKKELFYNRFKGPSLELLLQDDEINRFFRAHKLTKVFLGEKVQENGFFKVGYSNAFKNPDTAVQTLNRLKHESS